VIAKNYYDEIGAIIVLIILSVAVIDILSERLRSWATGWSDR
jgi:ABC-type phosphate/phosphonate transport system permease subunit